MCFQVVQVLSFRRKKVSSTVSGPKDYQMRRCRRYEEQSASQATNTEYSDVE